MTGERALTGGCLCGRCRYRIEAAAEDGVVCHCRMCQRAGGGPAQAYARFPLAALSWQGDAPAAYASSPGRERRFCRACGGQLGWIAAAEPHRVWISLGSLDDPAAVRPARHEHAASAPPWDDFADGLPAFIGARPAAA